MQNKELQIKDTIYNLEYYCEYNVNLEIIDIINSLIESIMTTRRRNEGLFSFMRDVSFSKKQLDIKTQLLEDILKYIISQKFSRKEFRAPPSNPKKVFNQEFLTELCTQIMQMIDYAIELSIDLHWNKVYPMGEYNPDAINKLSWQGLETGFSRSEFRQKLQSGTVGTDTHLLLFKLKADFQTYQHNVISKPGSYHAQCWPIYEIRTTKALLVQRQLTSDLQSFSNAPSYY